MYLESPPTSLLSITSIQIKYDCCGREHTLKWKDADKNFKKNDGKHICRLCWLKLSNPAKTVAAKNKSKKTNLERYGTSMPINSQAEINKRVEKFKNPEFVDQWNEKRRKTSLEKYGTEHPTQAEEVRDKIHETNLDRYGVKVPLQNEDIKKKQQQTVLERDGVDNIAKLPATQAKMNATTEERYGVKHYNELPEMREWMSKHCKEWLAESWAAGGPNKGVPKSDEIRRKASETVSQKILDGTFLSGPKNCISGWFEAKKCVKEKPYFRSTQEAVFHYYLNHNEEVDFYDYEPFSIPYVDLEGKNRRYHPDFVVKFKNRDKLILIEIKPRFRMRELETENKVKYGEQWAEIEGMTFEYWDEQAVTDLGIDPKMVLESHFVKLSK